MTGYTRILCPIDFSEPSRRALRYASATARWYGAKLIVLHVFPEVPAVDIIPSLVVAGSAPNARRARDRERTAEMLERFVHDVVPHGVDVEWRMEDEADAALEIARDAAEYQSELIVMGTHGRTGYERLLLGSTAETVVRGAPCPVVVVPSHADGAIPPGDPEFDSVLCAVDFSECSLEALAAAMLLAEDADALLTLLNVVDVPPELHARASLGEIDINAVRAADTASRLRHLRQLVPDSARVYCHVETMVGEGKASREILRIAAERRSDLIVMGVKGRSALSRLVLGSTTHDVLRGSTCPVLILHKE